MFLRQVLPRKPDSVGIKVDVLGERNGYVCNAEISSKEPLKYEETIGRTGAVEYMLLTSSNLKDGKNFLWQNHIVSRTSHLLACRFMGTFHSITTHTF